MDRLLDQACTGPRYLSQPAIARLAVEALHYGQASLQHYPLHAFVGIANHLHLLITPQVAVPKLLRSLKGITAKRANQILGLTGQGAGALPVVERHKRTSRPEGRRQAGGP